MNRRRVVAIIPLCALGLALVACQPRKGGSASSTPSMIAEAQAKSVLGANPRWLQFTKKRELFKRVRNRAYSYCSTGVKIDQRCASEQDEAVEASVMALHIAAAQAEMTDKESLGLKEHYVATNPEIAPRVANACWALYKEHGSTDARILSFCLGNLTDFSPLIPLPVP